MKIKTDIIVEANGSVSCYMVSIVEILCVLKGKSKLTKFVVNFCIICMLQIFSDSTLL